MTNTGRLYELRWQRFTEWMLAHEHEPLPASPLDVVDYFQHLAESGASASIMMQARASISEKHRLAGLIDCTGNPAFRAAYKRICGTKRGAIKGYKSEMSTIST